MACNDAAASKHFKAIPRRHIVSIFNSLIQQPASVKSSAPTRPPLKVSRLTTQAHRSIDLQNLVKQPAAVKFSVPPRPPPRTSKRYHAFAKLGLIFQALVKPTAYRGRHRCPHRRPRLFPHRFHLFRYWHHLLHYKPVCLEIRPGSAFLWKIMARTGPCFPTATL